jgi:hypothetical protein
VLRTRVTVVPSHAAEIMCGLLRSEGIDAAHRTADVSVEGAFDWGGWREILVPADDLTRARELITSAGFDHPGASV